MAEDELSFVGKLRHTSSKDKRSLSTTIPYQLVDVWGLKAGDFIQVRIKRVLTERGK